MKVSIAELMATSGVAFGTSGARGLATAMTDRVCYAYTRGFIHYLETIGEGQVGKRAIAVAGDFRPSTGRIMEAVSRAAESTGCAGHSLRPNPLPRRSVVRFGTGAARHHGHRKPHP